MSKTMKLFSPAKINLRLDVLGKRSDGYHEIKSIMTRISLYDEITINIEEGSGLFVSSSGEAPSGEKNIAFRAALMMLDSCRVPHKITIRIEKNIPVGAGLGGGSSNAAAVMMGLNTALNCGLANNELMDRGLRLGADVPFFMLQGSALASGIGEILEEIHIPKLWFVLINPKVFVSTADIYSRLGLKFGLTTHVFDINMHELTNKPPDYFAELLNNDLEATAASLHPEISDVRKAVLSSGALAALMSGSGATVFGCYKGLKEAENAWRSLSARHRDWLVFLVSNI